MTLSPPDSLTPARARELLTELYHVATAAVDPGPALSVRLERLAYTVGFAVLFGFILWITIFDIARLGGAVQ